MKTTVDIPDALLAEARRVAAEQNTTLRELIEAGLREVVQSRRRPRRFRLRDASVGGQGLCPDFRAGEWARIREAAYEGRGG
ncbi:MAG TPA: type II toxin-antitoxin system VapB family antitoxin [Egibacteraceae bacterium]|nr:type II toxin-antitoxin system VapB family antitoxin [Actinomycetota bacterium]HWB71534.1 type II toxin-antitoxin system VapB family antitoxin [Egibacteraceae bacterium]